MKISLPQNPVVLLLMTLCILITHSGKLAGQTERFLLGGKLPKRSLNAVIAANDEVILVESRSQTNKLIAYSRLTLKEVKSMSFETPHPLMESFWHKTKSGVVALSYAYNYSQKTLQVYSRVFSFDLSEDTKWEQIYTGTVINHQVITPYAKPVELYPPGEKTTALYKNPPLYERGFDTIPSTGSDHFYFVVRGKNSDDKDVVHVFGINEQGQPEIQKEIVLPAEDGPVLVNSAIIHENKMAMSLVFHDCDLVNCDGRVIQTANGIMLVDLGSGEQVYKVIEKALGETGIVANKQISLVYDQQREIAWAVGILSAKATESSRMIPLGTEKIGFFQLGISLTEQAVPMNNVRLFTASEKSIFSEMSGGHIEIFESWIDEKNSIKTMFYAPYAMTKRVEYNTYNTRTGKFEAPEPGIQKTAEYHSHELLILTVDTLSTFKLLDIVHRKSCWHKTDVLGETRVTLNGKHGFLFLDAYNFYDEQKNRKVSLGDAETHGGTPNRLTFATLTRDDHWEFQRVLTATSIELYPEKFMQISENQLVGIGRKGLTRYYLFQITLEE